MKKTCRVFVLILAFLMLGLSACAAPSASPMPQAAMATSAPAAAAREEAGYGGGYNEAEMADMAAPQAAPAEMPAPAQNSVSSSTQNALAQRKIIRDASITIETDMFEQNLKHIEEKINSIGGYIENSYLQGRPPEEWQANGRTVQITARVPQESFEAFIRDVEGTGKVIELSRGSNDVTMQYFDNESHINTLKIQLARLEDILTQSQKLADIITLENEIGRVRYEIESLTTTQRRYDDLVQYSTVNVSLHEVKEITYVQTPSEDFGSRINSAFVSVINALVTFFEWLVIFLVGAFPILLIAGIILWLVFFIRRKVKKRRNAKATLSQAADDAPKGDANNP